MFVQANSSTSLSPRCLELFSIDQESLLSEIVTVENDLNEMKAYHLREEMHSLIERFLNAEPKDFARIYAELLVLRTKISIPTVRRQESPLESGSTIVVYTKESLSDIARLSPHLRKRFDEFIVEVRGRRIDLLMSEGRLSGWNFERLGLFRFGQGKFFAVKLNREYKIVFELLSSKEIRIIFARKSIGEQK